MLALSPNSEAECSKPSNLLAQEPPPLVIVEGFLSSAGSVVWGDFERYLNATDATDAKLRLTPRRTIFVSVGPVSSLHDRACELFYALKGGIVDYGATHALRHKHRRYGRRHDVGLYPEWSPDQPLHFFGHSIGGPTIMKLQWLLQQEFFGPEHNADMLLSVTTVSAPFRGTQVVYSLGERTDSAPAVRPFSAGAFLAKGVHIASYLSPFLPRIFDMHIDSRGLSCTESSFLSFLRHLYKSDWAEGRDAAPFDVTFEAAEEREALDEGAPHPRTFYRSHIACTTERHTGPTCTHAPTLSTLLNPLLYLFARLIGSFDFSILRPAPAFLPSTHSPPPTPALSAEPSSPYSPMLSRNPSDAETYSTHPLNESLNEDYWANDGIVPVFSQCHPFDCERTRCIHRGGKMNPSRPVRGTWDVHALPLGCSHVSLVPLWIGSSLQTDFWRELGEWLRGVESDHTHMISP